MKRICLQFVFLITVINSSFAQNQSKVDSLLQVLQTNVPDSTQAKIYQQLARAYIKTDSLKVAQFANKAIELAKKTKQPFIESMALDHIGFNTMVKGHYDQALEICKKALAIALKHKILKAEGQASNTLGQIYWRKGKYAQTLKYFNRIAEISATTNNKASTATNYNNTATVYAVQGNYPKALEYFLKALEMFEVLDNKNGVSMTYNNLGKVYEIEKNYPKALEFYQNALKINTKMGYRQKMGLNYKNLGLIYTKLNDSTKAFDNYAKSLAILEKMDDRQEIASNYTVRGETYLYFKQYQKALPYFQKALGMYQALKQKPALANVLMAIGNTYYHLKNYSKAVVNLEKGIAISKEIKNLGDVRSGAQTLVQTYQAMGNYKAAFENQVLFQQMSDSILNKENIKKFTRLETTYEFEKEKDSIQFEQQKKQLAFDAEIKTRNAQQQTTYIGLGLLVVLLLVLLFFFRDKQRSNQKLNQVNKELAESNEEIKAVNEEVRLTNEEIKTVNEEIQSVNDKLVSTLSTVETQRDDIMSSISYAQRIQEAILPSLDNIREAFPESFVLFKPREMVSGDFYWFAKTDAQPIYKEDTGFETGRVLEGFTNEKQVIIAADCTGHGVPGGFLTMLCSQALNDIVIQKNIHDPGKILKELHVALRQMLQSESTRMRDGMDAAVVVVDQEAKTLQYAGAKNPLILIQNNELQEITGDAYSINGYRLKGDEVVYHSHTFDLNSPPTTFYIYSDGYQDQFGGDKGKKFMKKRLRELLGQIAAQPMAKQQQMLETTLNDWMGDQEQIDDILVMGVKIT